MRKLTRSILHHTAYKNHGGNKMFKQLWKRLRIKQGKVFVEYIPVTKRKSAVKRVINRVMNKGGK